MLKKKAFGAIIIICFLLCSCIGKGNKTSQVDSSQEWQYKKTVTEYDLASDEVNSLMFAVSDTALFYVAESHEEEGEEHHEIHSVNLETKEDVELLGLEEHVSDISLYESGQGLAIVSVLACDDETIHVSELDAGGKLIRSIPLKLDPEERFGLNGACRNGDGSYWIYWYDAYCHADADGNCQEKIHVSNGEINRIINLNNGEAYAEKYDKESQSYYLVDLQKNADAASEPQKVGEQVYPWGEEGFLTFMDGLLYAVDPKSGRKEELINLTDYVGVNADTLRAIRVDDGEFKFLCWSTVSGRFMAVLHAFSELSEEEKAQLKNADMEGERDKYGRLIVKVYDPMGMAVADHMVNEYNAHSEKYCVVVDRESKDDAILLTTKNAPDLIAFYNSTDVEKYAPKGYLVDLIPYLEKSDKLSAEDLMDWEFATYGMGDGLYAIARGAGVETLAVRKSEVGDEKGWTTDEYLSFLEKHPEIVCNEMLSEAHILYYGVLGNLEKYVDFENGKADFLQEDFKSVMRRIKNLKLKGRVLEPYEPLTEEDKGFLLYGWFPSVEEYANWRALTGDDFVTKGFPNDQGRKVSYLVTAYGLSIPQNAKCKEGAYDFLEYKMLSDRGGNNLSKYGKGVTTGYLYGLKDLYELDRENSIGPREVLIGNGYQSREEATSWKFEVTQEDIDAFEREVVQTGMDTLMNITIEIVIMQESKEYFYGDATVDAACDAIQKRVQLILDENR